MKSPPAGRARLLFMATAALLTALVISSLFIADLPMRIAISCLLGAVLLLVERAKLHHNETLRTLSYTDPLTGLPNRRCFREFLDLAFSRWKENKNPLGVIFLDVDDMKEINDRYGHRAGDRCLKSLAPILRENLPGTVLPCRWGGDEFAVILSGDDAKYLQEIARRLKDEADARLDLTSISVGVARAKSEVNRPEDLLKRADRRLRAEKRLSGPR